MQWSESFDKIVDLFLVILEVSFALVVLGKIGALIDRKYKRKILSPQNTLAAKINQLLPQHQSTAADMPLVGYRYLCLVIDAKDKHMSFGSVVMANLFGTVARARCHGNQDHAAPDEQCMCGYYSVKEIVDLPNIAFYAIKQGYRKSVSIAQVESYGTMYVGPKGQRAASQQVMRVWVRSRCFLCKSPASVIGVSKQVYNPIFEGSKNPIPPLQLLLGPVCDKHAQKLKEVYTIQDLREGLKTEVEWINE